MFSFCDQVAHPEEVAASKSLVSTSFSHFRQQPASVITCVYILYCNLAAQQHIYNNSKSLVQQSLVAVDTWVAELLRLGHTCQHHFTSTVKRVAVKQAYTKSRWWPNKHTNFAFILVMCDYLSQPSTTLSDLKSTFQHHFVHTSTVQW